MGFTIQEGNETHVTVSGKLDFARAPQLLDALTGLKGKGISCITFKCRDLTYISSSGIRAIIYAQQKISQNMTIKMENVSEDVMEVLDMCGIADFIEFTSSDSE